MVPQKFRGKIYFVVWFVPHHQKFLWFFVVRLYLLLKTTLGYFLGMWFFQKTTETVVWYKPRTTVWIFRGSGISPPMKFMVWYHNHELFRGTILMSE